MTNTKAASPQAGRFSQTIQSTPMMQPDNVMSMAGQTNSGGLVMSKHLLNCSVHVAAAALCLGAMINGTTAGSFTRGCAARDLQILMLIEQREETNAISAEKLSDAMVTMMNARIICYDGRVIDALATYDSVARSLTPTNLSQSKSPHRLAPGRGDTAPGKKDNDHDNTNYE
jgi:hypothetical protein